MFLSEHYKNQTPQWCADKLNLSLHSVKKKAVRLGLASERRSFTDAEIDFIKQHYEDMGPTELSNVLGANIHSVKGVAHRFSLVVSSETKGRTSARTNKLWIRTEETKRKIGDANRRHLSPSECPSCGREKDRRGTLCKMCELKSRGGEKHPWWNGGVSSLNQMVAHRLWTEWKYPILCRDRFVCQECGEHENLEVHHLRLFAEIRDEVIKANPNISLDTYDDKLQLVDLIVKEHRMEDGITLCYSCHKAKHFEKWGELLETLDEGQDNQQPSRLNVQCL